MGAGVLEALEIRVPVSPHHAILMTWRDEADDQDCRVRGTRDHAANLNAFTIAHAERQWFRQPGAPTPTALGSPSASFDPVLRRLRSGHGRPITTPRHNLGEGSADDGTRPA
jgi:hypothetical protein